MDGAQIRRVTTRAVTAALWAALACLAVGLVLLQVRHAHLEAGQKLRPLLALPGELLAGRSDAWLSLGVVGLLLTPLIRMLGMLIEFLTRGERRASLAAGAVSLLLILALVRGLGVV